MHSGKNLGKRTFKNKRCKTNKKLYYYYHYYTKEKKKRRKLCVNLGKWNGNFDFRIELICGWENFSQNHKIGNKMR